MIIGLTGKRGVGKSTIADVLEEDGFIRSHAFEGGKAATFGYFVHIGMPIDVADEAVYGRLRDEPNEYLPNNSTPRYFMEKFGHFMGVTLGSDWTLGTEIDRIQRNYPSKNIVIESVVYEAPLLRSRGGRIIRVTRPDHEGIMGMMTDAAQSEIDADFELINDGSVDDLLWKTEEAVEACKSLETRNS